MRKYIVKYFTCTRDVKTKTKHVNVKESFEDTYRYFVENGPKPQKVYSILDGIYNNHLDDPDVRERILKHVMTNNVCLKYFKIPKKDILKYPEVLNVSYHSFTTRKNAAECLTENQIKEYIEPICGNGIYYQDLFKDRVLSESFENFLRCKYPSRFL